MSTCIIKGNPKWPTGIPRNTRVRVELLPQRIPVFDQRCTKQAVMDLDPGLYSVTMVKYLGQNVHKRQSCLMWDSTFLHDLTPKQYEVLSSMRPHNFKGRQTSEGFILSCDYGGCDFTCQTSVMAIMHGLEHRGMTLQQVTEDSDLAMAMMDEAPIQEANPTFTSVDYETPPGMPLEPEAKPTKRQTIPKR